jgi:hypothetical protein
VKVSNLTEYLHIMAKMYINTVPCTNGDVRLVERYVGSGRIEVCDNNSWGTICSNSWDDIAASVACSQLGYSLYGTKMNEQEHQCMCMHGGSVYLD